MRLAAGLLLVALALPGAAASASSGTVTHLSGTLSARKADGSVRILSQKSKIENGDTISTERDSFAQIEFADGARLTLKPNTAVTARATKSRPRVLIDTPLFITSRSPFAR